MNFTTRRDDVIPDDVSNQTSYSHSKLDLKIRKDSESTQTNPNPATWHFGNSKETRLNNFEFFFISNLHGCKYRKQYFHKNQEMF